MRIPERFPWHNYYLFQQLNEMVGMDLAVGYFSLAENYYQDNDYKEADMWYNAAIEKLSKIHIESPDYTDCTFFLAEAYYKLGIITYKSREDSQCLNYTSLAKNLFQQLRNLDEKNETILIRMALLSCNIVYRARDFESSFNNCYAARNDFYTLMVMTNYYDDRHIDGFCKVCNTIAEMCWSMYNTEALASEGKAYYKAEALESLGYCKEILDSIKKERALSDDQKDIYAKSKDLLKKFNNIT